MFEKYFLNDRCRAVLVIQTPFFWNKADSFKVQSFAVCLSLRNNNQAHRSQNSHGLGERERYHAYLQDISDRIQVYYSDFNAKLILTFAFKACNNICIPNDSVLTLLVCDVVPWIAAHPEKHPRQCERIETLQNT